MQNVGFLGMGVYLPPKVLTNQDLEKIVDTNDEWIRTRTGIEERRIASDEETVTKMSYQSAVEALDESGLNAEDVELIIVATATSEHQFPSTACMVQEKLGAKKAVAFDISAACSGFIYGVVMAMQFMNNGVYKNALVIGAEKLSGIVDWTDRATNVLFGDGSGAVVLGEVPDGKGILSFELGSDGTGGKHLYGDPCIHMNGREVYKFAVRQMGESALNVVEKAGLKKEDVDFLVPHQANIRIMESARERLELPKEKMSVTVNRFGNTSAASIPISLYHDAKEGRVKDDDVLVLVGFGGGLTWGALTLKW